MKRSTLTADAARTLAAMRTTFAGGRPRSEAPRCDCGVMTLKRAQMRGKGPEHAPSCGFYRRLKP